MGQIVTVHAHVTHDRHEIENRYDVTITPVDPYGAWVVGYTYIQCGIFVPETRFHEDWEPSYINIKCTCEVLKVCPWPSMRHVFTTTDFITPGGTPMSPSARAMARFKHNRPATYRSLCKELSDYAREQRRDRKGRFIK